MKVPNWIRNNFRGGEPLRHFCHPKWFNRVANVLMDIQGVNCTISKPLNAEGRGWRITCPPPGQEPVYPFKGKATDSGVSVRIGKWYRNGDDASLAPDDSGGTYATIAANDGDYVWLERFDDTTGGPDYLELASGAAYTDDSNSMLIGQKTATGGWTQLRRGGYKDENCHDVDAHVASTNLKSIDRVAYPGIGAFGDCVHSLHGFASAADRSAAYVDLDTGTNTRELEWRVPVRYGGDAQADTSASITVNKLLSSGSTGDINIGIQKYSYTVSDGALNIEYLGDSTVWVDISSISDSLVQHDLLNFTSGVKGIAAANTAHDFRYWIQGEDYQYCCGQSIGYSPDTESNARELRIDLAAAKYYDSAVDPSKLSVDMGDRLLIRSNGTDTAVDWENNQLMGAWEVTDTFTAKANVVLETGGELTLQDGRVTLQSGSIYLADGYAINVGAFEGYTDTATKFVLGTDTGGSKEFYILGGVLCAVPS